MKQNFKKYAQLSMGLTALTLASSSSFAYEQIIRPFGTARSYAMGGTRYTTGLYEDNFFGNPARVNDNPRFRFTLFDPMIEGNDQISQTLETMNGDGDGLSKLSSTAGKNNHARLQTSFPAMYFTVGENHKWGFALGLLSNTQADIAVRQNYELDPKATLDIGPAFTMGRRLLENDALTLGMSAHLVSRVQTTQNLSFLDILRGNSFQASKYGGTGTMFDFDLGGMYNLPIGEGSPFIYRVGAAINNILGGKYSNLSPSIDLKCGGSCLPHEQPRTLNFGITAVRKEWRLLRAGETTYSIEMSDIGNNKYGSLFRLIHLGAETHWWRFAVRGGINQGYFTGGLGLDLRFLELDLTTYGEELTYNPGQKQDRRYAFKMSLHI